MDVKTPLRLKLKIGGGPSTPEPSSPADPSIASSKMADDDFDQMASDDDIEEDEFQEDGHREDLGMEEEDGQMNPQIFSHEDGLRERHKKSKKKKKKKEKEKHKHRHHRERAEIDDDEPSAKKAHTDFPHKGSSKASLAALKELLEHLLQHLIKKDPQNFFALPVTDVIAPGYSSIITTPMDFSLVTQKVKDNAYSTLNEFKSDLCLICNNCMVYNQPDTIYYRAAKKLLHAGERVFTPERILHLRKDIPNIMLLTKEQLGFDITSSSILILENDDFSRDSLKTSDNENSLDSNSKFQAIQDDLSAEEILEQAQKASKEAADRLTLKKPMSTLGFLRQRRDGTTTLNFLTGCEGSSGSSTSNPKEKTVNLGMLTGKLTQGSSSLNNYREDKRSMAKPVKPLNYGSFSSFCPSFDSTFANLTKEESEMVYATYGNETAVQYAESICDFSRDCDMAMHLVDQLLNLLTHEHHSRTKTIIEERRRMQQEEHKISALLYPIQNNSSVQIKEEKLPATPNFASLHSLTDLGIDTSFLNTFENMDQKEKQIGAKLEETGALIDSLSKEQKDRLSKPLPANLNNLPPPSQNEVKLAEKVTEGLISVAKQVAPGAIAPVPIVRRALGITMMPVTLDSSEQVEVGIERSAAGSLKTGSSSNQGKAKESDPTMPNIFQDAPSTSDENIGGRKLKEMLTS